MPLSSHSGISILIKRIWDLYGLLTKQVRSSLGEKAVRPLPSRATPARRLRAQSAAAEVCQGDEFPPTEECCSRAARSRHLRAATGHDGSHHEEGACRYACTDSSARSANAPACRNATAAARLRAPGSPARPLLACWGEAAHIGREKPLCRRCVAVSSRCRRLAFRWWRRHENRAAGRACALPTQPAGCPHP